MAIELFALIFAGYGCLLTRRNMASVGVIADDQRA